MQMDYSILAFLDVLGFSAMVERDSRSTNPKFLPVFVEIFEEIAKEANGKISLRMFSDSIVIEATLSPNNVIKLIEVVGELQRRFLGRHILLRGGVAFGKHFMNDYVTFSQALVSAYGIESRIARFPRVVISDDLLNYTWHHADTTAQFHDYLRHLLMVDRDNATFVNYLSEDSLQSYRSHVESCIHAEPHPHETVLEKMRWLLDYYNFQASHAGKNLIESDHFTNGFSHLITVS